MNPYSILYGSRLYGTETPQSDYDLKTIYLPSKRELYLAKQASVHRSRQDASGQKVSDNKTMPDGGSESEQIPLQKFVADWFTGQAYAVEFVFAVLQGSGPQDKFYQLCEKLSTDFLTPNVQGMVGFALKQTIDYVRRGERLNAARGLKTKLADLEYEFLVSQSDLGNQKPVRLDSIFWGNSTMLDELTRRTGLQIGISKNGERTTRTLLLNGREYLETTATSHLHGVLSTLIDKYGDRSTSAAENAVDWKSLSHAVRVYEQVIEYLTESWITFPRPNAPLLLSIKQGEHSLESVKNLLRKLDDEVNALIQLKPQSQVKIEDFEDYLYNFIVEQLDS